jgi:hypothetical protein
MYVTSAGFSGSGANFYIGAYSLGMNYFSMDPDIPSPTNVLSQAASGETKCAYYSTGGSQTYSSDCMAFMSYRCQISSKECSMNSTCPSGTFLNSSRTRPQCSPCPVGSYQDAQNSFSCNLCTVGFFQNITGQSVCHACSQTTSSDVGSTRCGLCLPGSYQEQLNQTSCIQCRPGSYQDTIGGSSCKICTLGRFGNTTGLPACFPCSVGLYQDVSNSSSCNACPPGSFQNTTGVSFCNPCSLGTYSDTAGMTECSLCPIGLYQDSLNASSCKSCVAGQFQSSSGQSTCIPCPRGFYSNSSGLSECITCQNSGTLAEGSNDISQCACNEGFYGKLPEIDCVQCTTNSGVRCPFNCTIPWIDPQYFRKGTTGTDVMVALRCTPGEACERTENASATICKIGYQGFVCGQCSKGYYRSGSFCKQCPGDGIKWLTISVAILVVALILMRVTSRKTELPVDLRITLQAVQLIALFPNITTKWPSYVSVVLQIYSIAVS